MRLLPLKLTGGAQRRRLVARRPPQAYEKCLVVPFAWRPDLQTRSIYHKARVASKQLAELAPNELLPREARARSGARRRGIVCGVGGALRLMVNVVMVPLVVCCQIGLGGGRGALQVVRRSSLPSRPVLLRLWL